jgi:putative tryptophan/tyrosine transport system substrate-binding protein
VKRREFITLLGGAAAAWPDAAQAQQQQAMPVIGFLRSTPSAPFMHFVAAFQQGLKEEGFVEGQNVAIEYRWADNQLDRLPGLAAELVQRKVAVIVGNTPAALAAKAATATVPIVFVTGSDPVRDGLVASLNRPGGNVTGVSFLAGLTGTKLLELLRQVAPKATTIAVLVNPNSPETVAQRQDVQAAAQAIGQPVIILDVEGVRDIEAAFATFVERGAGALLIGTGPFMNSHRERLAALAAHYRLPAIFSLREFPAAGGLMSYGTSTTDGYRQAGNYVGRILKGEKPGDLPVMLPTKFEFVINLKTAKALGLEIPDRLLALADEVIE